MSPKPAQNQFLSKFKTNRIDKMKETEAYITIKDHNKDFSLKIYCHLINPSKSSIDNISKVILDKINNTVQ